MGRITRAVIATLLAAAGSLGITTSAQGANALCPQVCLTGGILGLGVTRSTVSTASVESLETREYGFSWTAFDLTETLPIQEELNIEISASGTTENGIFTGSGEAFIEKVDGNSTFVDVDVIATALTITVTSTEEGEDFQLNATVLGGGEASYSTEYDHEWEYVSYSE